MLIDDSFIYKLDSTGREDIAMIIKDPGVLNRLANDEDSYVRSGVASNPNTPPETLDRLANDEDYCVRRGVSYNPNTPQYILDLNKFKYYLKHYVQS